MKTIYIELGSPWDNGYNESINGKLWEDMLDGGIFYGLMDAKVPFER